MQGQERRLQHTQAQAGGNSRLASASSTSETALLQHALLPCLHGHLVSSMVSAGLLNATQNMLISATLTVIVCECMTMELLGKPAA